jgi:nucleoside-diphosphate-sugar epimerase
LPSFGSIWAETGDAVSGERFLVTGATGCIGAWVCAVLREEGTPVIGLSRTGDRSRLDLVGAGDVELAQGDIVARDALEAVLDGHRITHVVHLAALLIPEIRKDPALGARVNVEGTVNVFAASAARGISLSWASSIAVYSRDDDVGDLLHDEAVGRPMTFYGVHKQACENLARVFWQDVGLPSIGLRPYIVYGPGRDSGLTASPTLAMAAAARGEPARIAFGGTAQLQFAPDVARIFVSAARAVEKGAKVFNLGGAAVHMREVADLIQASTNTRVVVDEDVTLPFPDAFDNSELERMLGRLEWTPLQKGIEKTVARYRSI